MRREQKMLQNNLIEKIIEYKNEKPLDKVYYLLDKNADVKQSLNYIELYESACQISLWLQRNGRSGDRVLLLFPPGLEFIQAFIGCLFAGMIGVPVSTIKPKRNSDLLSSILGNAKPALILTESNYFQKLSSQPVIREQIENIPSLSINTPLDEDTSLWKQPEIEVDTVAFLQYTSGSTSTPKGVVITHGNIVANQELIHNAFSFDQNSVVYGWLPFFHDMGLIGNILQPLKLGNPCYLSPPMDFIAKPSLWLKAISKYKVTISGGPNFGYDHCVDHIQDEEMNDFDLSSWKVAFNGSEPVSANTIEKFHHRFQKWGFNSNAMYPCYGMAEATLFISGKDVSSESEILPVCAKDFESGVITNKVDSSQRLVNCESYGAMKNLKSSTLNPKKNFHQSKSVKFGCKVPTSPKAIGTTLKKQKKISMLL